MVTIILVTGGARSGRSWFAEELCRELDGRVGYIATSQVRDDEMKIRVHQHQIRRPAHWQTWESPECDEAVLSDAREHSDVLLFDCLTLYLTYWMLHTAASKEQEKREKWLLEKLEELLTGFRDWPGTLIFVTNEVGLGIVPENKLAREFRDLAGKMNARVAQEAKEVYLVVAGQAMPVKKYAVNPKEAVSSWNLKKN